MISSVLSDINIPSAKTIIFSTATIAATAMVVRSVARGLIPYELQHYVYLSIRGFFKSFSSEIVLIIEEFDGLANNQIYKAAEIYLGSKVSISAGSFRVSMPEKETKISTLVAKDRQVLDKFNGVQFKWRQVTRQESNKVKEEKKTLQIYTMNGEHMRRYSGDYTWNSIKLDHPATFDTLAMDRELKEMIVGDLESLIAAMANYLNFDIYDLELTDIRANSELRRVLLFTGNRSILVVEDIDCSLDIEDRKAEEQTLKALKSHITQAQTINIVRKPKPQEGLLNFIDGLWSSCGDERIIVFTTNHKDRLDSALLRPGRMDVHINMSYCTPCTFQTLVSNYLGIEDHPLFPEIFDVLNEAMVTPAEVAEQLLRNEGVETAMSNLLDFIHKKKKEADEFKAKGLKNEQTEGDLVDEITQE
ncbi:hypothetical protein RND71_021286 [Anisodus tanguticus]|uniref:Uncharacterized protein n=1 Tax=Anisodus tanguticus TaxID=243964 RepID=A0AAE1RXT9_9SOLA|nr:hypothetical protein RND71_021286 [Anisodus tanguticus]